jgi:polyisoprenyl-phosphate glycosyltransferase
LQKKLLSLVIPVYFEQECIQEFIKQVSSELEKLDLNYEIIFVDDGSTDNTVSLIKEEIKTHPFISLIELSYNQGKEVAITTAIHYAKGDYMLYMDPDLQDPPERIKDFVIKIEEGYDLVLGIREEKHGSLLDKLCSWAFWETLRNFTGLTIPKGIAVMRIFNRKFANQFLKYQEKNRFIEGIFMDIGMNWTQIIIENRPRFAGVSKFNFIRKIKLAMRAIFNYSDVPLHMTSVVGVILLVLGIIFSLGIILVRLIFDVDFKLGWPSLIIIITLGFGLQIFLMGIIARYIGNIYIESKRRPLFSIKATTNIEVNDV